jgi:pteridine reductase
MDLTNRAALVTGGAHRLGRAIALALADAGANVTIHYHGAEEAAHTTVAELEQRGVGARRVRGNLADTTEAARVVDAAAEHWGQLDVLVCNAGIWGATPLDSATPERWDELYAINTRAPFFLTQRAAPHLRAAGGCMLAITDAGVAGTWKHYTPYLSSKAALAMVVQNLAKDLAPEARANAVAPGPVLLPEDWDEEKRARAARSTLVRRLGTPEDIADAVVFLARADFISGVVLPVDGGQRLK